MRLALKDTEKRVVIKYDNSITSSGDKVNGYMKFGTDNDYPQIIERVVNSSITGKSVANIYAKFLCGLGFENADLNDKIIGKDSKGKNITPKTLLRYVAESIAMNNGTYIHTNLNLDGKIVNVRPLPFKHCRFAAIDDNGYTAKIGVYDNWEKDSDIKRRKGQSFDKRAIVWYPIYNPKIEVLAAQVKEIGGDINKFKGQIYFHFLDNYYLYPLSLFDPVIMDCDTENQVAIFKNSMTRNGMVKKSIVTMVEPQNEEDEEALVEEVKNWQGMDGPSVLVVYGEIDKETGEIKKSNAIGAETLESNIDDKLFEGWQRELANNIRKAAKGLPAILIDYEEGKLSTTSGEAIIQATNFYNAITEDDRSAISAMFKELLGNFEDQEIAKNTDWNIKKLSLYNPQQNGTIT